MLIDAVSHNRLNYLIRYLFHLILFQEHRIIISKNIQKKVNNFSNFFPSIYKNIASSSLKKINEIDCHLQCRFYYKHYGRSPDAERRWPESGTQAGDHASIRFWFGRVCRIWAQNV